MIKRSDDAWGFSLIEVIVAMFILGLLAIALLPSLWQGIQFSSEQSSVATATRHLNGLVEEARANPSCGRTIPRPVGAPTTVPPDVPAIPNVAAFAPTSAAWNGISFSDGRGSSFSVVARGAAASNGVRAAYVCVPNAITEFQLSALDSTGETVALVTAKILMGP